MEKVPYKRSPEASTGESQSKVLGRTVNPLTQKVAGRFDSCLTHNGR
jgi:hypothetical protein